MPDVAGKVAHLSPSERLWMRVDKTKTCWLWTGARTFNGYGQVRIGDGRRTGAHRLSYELEYGPIPEGLDIDHLCRNRACVRPDHLEAVTRRVNLARGAHPKSGREALCPISL